MKEVHVDLSRHDPGVAAMAARIIAYRLLVKRCPHIDGWRSFDLIAPLWQCISCGLITSAEDRTKLERWPQAQPEPEALGTAIAAWANAP